MSRATYQTIRDEVLRRIHTGRWKPGALIPPEAELATEFACARATVSRALRELAEAGVLERRRKAGTRVSRTPVRKATLEIPVVRLEVEGRGATYRHKILSRTGTTAPAHVIARMNLPQGARVLHLLTLHMANEQPFMFEDRWINPAAVPEIENIPFEKISVNEWLVQNIPISGGDITFLADRATVTEAETLNLAPGAALFVIERITWRNAQTITATRLAYPPGYRMTTRI